MLNRWARSELIGDGPGVARHPRRDGVDLVDELGQGGRYLRKLFPIELAFKHTVVDAQTVVFEECADTLAAAIISNVISNNGQHSVT